MADTAALVRFSPHALAALRIMAGLLFLAHGTVKLFGWPEVEGMGRVPLASLAGIGGVIEFIGGALIALGLFTRIAAFIASGEMAVAYFLFHAPQGFYPDRQWRRCGDPLLLHLPLSGLRRPGQLQPRCRPRGRGELRASA